MTNKIKKHLFFPNELFQTMCVCFDDFIYRLENKQRTANETKHDLSANPSCLHIIHLKIQ